MADTKDAISSLVQSVGWHDSVVYSIECIRRDSADEVVILADLLHDWEQQSSCSVRLVFHGCLRVNMDLHWGVVCMSGGEMISGLDLSWDGKFIDSIWNEIRRHAKDIAHVRLTFASTGSTIDIAATAASIVPLFPLRAHPAPPPLIPGQSGST